MSIHSKERAGESVHGREHHAASARRKSATCYHKNGCWAEKLATQKRTGPVALHLYEVPRVLGSTETGSRRWISGTGPESVLKGMDNARNCTAVWLSVPSERERTPKTESLAASKT